MKRIIMLSLISCILLNGCGVKDKIDKENNVTIDKDIDEISNILNDLDHLDKKMDDIADEDLISD